MSIFERLQIDAARIKVMSQIQARCARTHGRQPAYRLARLGPASAHCVFRNPHAQRTAPHERDCYYAARGRGFLLQADGARRGLDAKADIGRAACRHRSDDRPTGHTAFHRCHGKRDLARDADATPETIYRIYSMTKPLTAVAIMMLYEEGRFQLDDAITRYL